MDPIRVVACAAEDEDEVREAEWALLAASDPEATVYLTPAFLRTYAHHRPSWNPPLRLLCAREVRSGRLLGLLPYSIPEGRALFPAPASLGDPGYLMQRRGPLLLPGPSRQAVLSALCAALLREPWQRLRAPALLPEHGNMLGAALRQDGAMTGLRPSLRSPYVPLPCSWDNYLVTRSRAMREVLTSRARRLERKHGATVRVLTAPDEVQAAWPEVQEVARHSWSHRQGTSVLVPTGPERMFRPLLAAAAERGLLWLGVLHLDGRPAAVEIDLVFAGVVYVQKPFYDERVASLSPGQYLMGRMVRRAIEHGLREYDLGGDDEPYKLRFADRVREHVVLWAYRRRPAALAEYLLRHHLRP